MTAIDLRRTALWAPALIQGQCRQAGDRHRDGRFRIGQDDGRGPVGCGAGLSNFRRATICIRRPTFLKLTAQSGRQKDGDRGLARSGNTHNDSDHRFGDGMAKCRRPDALSPLVVAHAAARRSTNLWTALAKPSSSLLSVTALACALTSSLAFPMAIEKLLSRNMRTSFGISPTVTIWVGRNVQKLRKRTDHRAFICLRVGDV